MTTPPISQAPRPTLTRDVLDAARKLSPLLWGGPYKPGRGPIHWATGPWSPKELRRKATEWRRLANAADLIAGWWEYVGDDPERATKLAGALPVSYFEEQR